MTVLALPAFVSGRRLPNLWDAAGSSACWPC